MRCWKNLSEPSGRRESITANWRPGFSGALFYALTIGIRAVKKQSTTTKIAFELFFRKILSSLLFPNLSPISSRGWKVPVRVCCSRFDEGNLRQPPGDGVTMTSNRPASSTSRLLLLSADNRLIGDFTEENLFPFSFSEITIALSTAFFSGPDRFLHAVLLPSFGFFLSNPQKPKHYPQKLGNFFLVFTSIGWTNQLYFNLVKNIEIRAVTRCRGLSFLTNRVLSESKTYLFWRYVMTFTGQMAPNLKWLCFKTYSHGKGS